MSLTKSIRARLKSVVTIVGIVVVLALFALLVMYLFTGRNLGLWTCIVQDSGHFKPGPGCVR